MRKGDFLWAVGILVWVVLLIVPETREAFERIVSRYVFTSSFVKFAMLATMGELLGKRLATGAWHRLPALGYRAAIWGLIGIFVAIAFNIFSRGVGATQAAGLIPGSGNTFLTALFTSVSMNLTFGPMLFVFHRFTDLYLDLRFVEHQKRITIGDLVDRNDWQGLVRFTWIKTIFLFWIPAHTCVFLLPANYRILASAFLSIALGGLLSIGRRKKG